jgi:hypothetical protein
LALTDISLPVNAGTAVHTTNVTPDTPSHGRLGREHRLVSDEWDFQRIHPISLAASASLLSSFTAFDWGRLLLFIICENERLSRLRSLSELVNRTNYDKKARQRLV